MDNTVEKEFSGVLLINKHAGATSHDIVSKVRRVFNTKRVGHTGTLDPMATGVLVVLVGRAAKACEYLSHDQKKYRAVLKLGITTDTEDITGNPLTQSPEIPDAQTVISVCRDFVGNIKQIPPMYSALKVDGRKLCDLAREGKTVEREARDVTVFSLECKPTQNPSEFILDVHCSGGTYIRTLCADIGEKLCCGGVMASLIRTETSGFSLSDCITIDELKEMAPETAESRLLPVELLFSDLPELKLQDFYRSLIRNGCSVALKKLRLPEETDGRLRLSDKDGRFFALGEVRDTEDGRAIKAIKLFDLD